VQICVKASIASFTTLSAYRCLLALARIVMPAEHDPDAALMLLVKQGDSGAFVQ